MTQQNSQTSAFLSVIAACFLYSCLYPAYRYLDGLVNPTELIAYRTFIALPILSVVHRKSLIEIIYKLSSSRFDLLLVWARAWLAYGVAGIGFAYAIMNGSLVAVALIANVSTFPVWGWILYGEKLERREVICFFAGLVAVGLLVVDSWQTGIGICSVIISILSNLSLSFVISAQRLHRVKLSASEWSVATLFFGLVLALLCLPIAPTVTTTREWSLLAMVSLVVAGLTLVFTGPLVNFAAQNLKSYTIGQLLLFEIPLVCLFNIFFYANMPSVAEMISAIIIIGAVYAEVLIYKKKTLPAYPKG